MYAIFKIYSKQYFVNKGEIIYTDKLTNDINSKIEFNDILFIKEKENIFIGKPYLKNRKVIALVLDHIKDKKIEIIKFKRRKHYLKKYNNRKLLTKLKICDIL